MSGGAGMQQWKPYPAYKDSGVEWLGQVPEGWEVKKISRLFQIINGSTPSANNAEFWDGAITWVTPADLSCLATMEIHDSSRKITEQGLNSCGTSIVKTGSIVLSTRAPIGLLGIAMTSLCTNQGCKSLTPKSSTSTKYAAYELIALKKVLVASGSGTTFLELSTDVLKQFVLVVPELSEQQTIATFLDQECARIDALIAKKRRLLELLEEKRRAVITQAVTRGLDSNAPMKDSGVEWLGQIPKEWDVKRLKFCSTFINDGTHFTPQYAREGIPFLRVTDISSLRSVYDKIDWDTVAKISPDEHFELIKRCNPEKGDLLVSKNGTIGIPKVVDWDEEFSIFVSLCLIKLEKTASAYFIYYYFKSTLPWTEIAIGGKTGTITNLHLDKIKEFRLSFPSVDIQNEIVCYLNEVNIAIDAQRQAHEKSIALLQEYRASLITHAVTGKIDVRDYAPRQ